MATVKLEQHEIHAIELGLRNATNLPWCFEKASAIAPDYCIVFTICYDQVIGPDEDRMVVRVQAQVDRGNGMTKPYSIDINGDNALEALRILAMVNESAPTQNTLTTETYNGSDEQTSTNDD